MIEFAYQEVCSANSPDFCSLTRSFPAMLQINGLSAAIAFLCTKETAQSAAHGKLYKIITNWLDKKFHVQLSNDLLKQITQMDSQTYRLYTNEVMTLCIWIKRFAEGMGDNNDPTA